MMKLTLVLLAIFATAFAQTCPGDADVAFPQIDRSSFLNEVGQTILTFYVYAPKALGAELSIDMGDDTETACDVVDNAPISGDFWTANLDGPCNVFTFSADRSDALDSCGFDQESGTGVVSFVSNPKFTNTYTNTDVFGNNQARVDQSDITLAINYPTEITVDADIFVTPAAVTYAATTSSEFNTGNGAQTYTFVTQGPNPYQLSYAPSNTDSAPSSTTGAFSFSFDTAVDGSITPVNSGCGVGNQDGTGNNICTQTWTFTMTPTTTTLCEGDQVITLNFVIGCASGFAGACDDLETNTAQFTITVDTDNYCPQVVEVANVAAAITTRSTSHAGPTSTSYTFGGVVYGTVELTIPSGIRIEETTITQIDIDNGCTGTCSPNIVLWQNNGATTAGGAAQGDAIVEDNSRVTGGDTDTTILEHQFSFIVNEFTVDFDGGGNTGTTTININVDMTVTYVVAATQALETMTYRQMVPMTTGTAIGLAPSAQAGVSTPGQASSSSTVLGVTQGTAIIAGVALVAVLALAVVAAVTIRKQQASSLTAKAQASSSSVQLQSIDEDAANTEAGIVGTDDLRMVQTAYGHA